MKHPIIYFAISLCVLVPGTISLIKFGLKPAIDFTGGSLVELSFQNKNITDAEIIQNIPSDIQVIEIKKSDNNSFLLQTKPITKDQNELIKQKLASQSGQLEELRFETTGPILGSELLKKTLTAIIISAILILLYVAYRFKNLKFGISAIIAMFHDSFVVLGIFSLLGHFKGVEVDTLFVTALLTILSFSVHDTIVVFDRIRESSRIFPKAKFVDLINKAVNETLARSINNSMTIIFMLLALWLMGGETTKWFVFTLLIGTIGYLFQHFYSSPTPRHLGSFSKIKKEIITCLLISSMHQNIRF
jgi:preprotein translocase subunit SecF